MHGGSLQTLGGDSRILSSGVDENGEEVIYACVLLDVYRSNIVDQMDNSYNFPGDDELNRNLIAFKLRLLSRFVNLDWDEYVQGYLKQ